MIHSIIVYCDGAYTFTFTLLLIMCYFVCITFSVGPINYPQPKVNIIFSSLSQQLNLTFSFYAHPKPSSVECTMEAMDTKESSVDIKSYPGTSMLKNLIFLNNDVYEFTLTVEMSGPESFGNYKCSISNGIGEPLVITYTIEEQDGRYKITFMSFKFSRRIISFFFSCSSMFWNVNKPRNHMNKCTLLNGN